MSGNSQGFKEKPACTEKAAPFPAEINCPDCSALVEMWSDETDTACRKCGRKITAKERG